MKVRTTQRPDVELDVEAAEYTDLARQGLLVDTSLPRRAPERAVLPADVIATTENAS
jgi:hypothetical protein